MKVECEYIVECSSDDELDNIGYDNFQDGFQNEKRISIEDYDIIDIQEID